MAEVEWQAAVSPPWLSSRQAGNYWCGAQAAEADGALKAAVEHAREEVRAEVRAELWEEMRQLARYEIGRDLSEIERNLSEAAKLEPIATTASAGEEGEVDKQPGEARQNGQQAELMTFVEAQQLAWMEVLCASIE